MNSNSKRKNRSSGVVSNRYTNDNRPPKGRPQAQGVYNNTQFMQAATPLVGNVVQVCLRSGNMYEGVFRTFSTKFDVALELPLCITANKTDSEEGKAPNFMIFPYDTVVSITAKDFDSKYATVGAFQTDAAISEKYNGSRFEEKELEPWDSSELNGDIDIELDGAANGWDANEMFLKNENQFGVQSTFDDSLSTYTVQIDKMDSEEFKAAEAKAEKLAAEIENNPVCRERLDLENGDEESLYAAVERPGNNSNVEGPDREKVLERERDRDRDLEDRERKQQHQPQQRQPMVERYITKPTRSNMHQSIYNTSSVGSSVSNVRTTSRNQGETINDRNMSAQIGGMKGAGNSINMNMAQDNSGKYSGSMSKRRVVTQSSKVTRNQSSGNNQNSGGSGGENNGGSIGSASQAGNNNSNSSRSNDGGKVSLTGSQMPVDRGNMDRFPYGLFTYKYNSDANGNMGKSRVRMNEDSKKQVPIGRSVAQIMRDRDMDNTSNSPPLQTNSSVQHAQNSGGVTTAPQSQVQPPQPQRQLRQRDNQIQELRQFGQDFQLAGSNTVQSSQKQQQHPTQTQPSSQQQIQAQQHQQQLHPQQQTQTHSQQQAHTQQQQQQEQTQQQQPHTQQQSHTQQAHPQQLIPLNKVVAQGLQPPPAVSPPQHISTQQSTQNVTMQHVPHHVPQHHHLPPQQLVHAASPPQQIYLPPQVVQQHPQPSTQLPPPQQMPPPHLQQSKPQQLVDSNIIHISKVVSGPSQSQQAQSQQSIVQEQLQPQQQTVYHTVPVTTQSQQQQSSPVIIASPDVENMQQPPPLQQPQSQQQQQQQMPQPQPQPNTKTDNSQPVSGSSTSVNGTVAAASSIVNAEKTTPSSSATVSGTTTTTVKKPHVLNPSAKPFTPRSPSTPNPSRPHTPQTPVPIANIYAPATHVPNNQAQIFVMQPQQHTAFQPPAHPQAGQQPRMRRGNYDNLALGPMGSQVHVSATTATGQPLLAAAPLQQFIHYQQSPHATHFQSQPYASMVRMYDGPQPLQFIAQSPPSTTPSPGQPHQAFHQQAQPSPAGGGPQPAFAPQTQPYQMLCPVIHPSLVPNYYPPGPQHPQQNQQYQIVMPQHPAQ